jgi:hypothetical protein
LARRYQFVGAALATVTATGGVRAANPAVPAAEALNHELVRGDEAAQTIVRHLEALHPATPIEVLGKSQAIHAVTGHTYTTLKARIGERDTTATINETTGAFAPDPGLAEREGRQLLNTLPPVYRKMDRSLVGQVRDLQGGVLGAAAVVDHMLPVLFYTRTRDGLDAIQAELGNLPSERFDLPELWAKNPPIMHPNAAGVVAAAPAPRNIRAIEATIPLSKILAVGGKDFVLRVAPGGRATPRLDVSVPHVHMDVVRGFVNHIPTSQCAIVDTGIDNTHPSLPFVIAEMDFTSSERRCLGGGNHGGICTCSGGAACIGGVCSGVCVAPPASVGVPCTVHAQCDNPVGIPNGICGATTTTNQACVAVGGCGTNGICENAMDDYAWHGTHVAGIAGSVDGGFTGTADYVDEINAKAIPGSNAVVTAALAFARDAGADIINGSFGQVAVCTAPPAMVNVPCVSNPSCDTAPGNGVCNFTSNGQSSLTVLVDDHVYTNNITVVIAAEELPYLAACSNNLNRPCNVCVSPAASVGFSCTVNVQCDSAPGAADGVCQNCTGGGVCQARPSTPNDAFNVITVGSSTVGATAGALAVWSTFSAVGPTADGRSKPDVLAPGNSSVPGDNIDSCNNNWEDFCTGPQASVGRVCTTHDACDAVPGDGVCGNNFTNFQDRRGTSMAAPHVSGLASVLWDFGDRNSILTDTPYIKAAIINNCTRLAGWTRPSNVQPLDPAQGAGEIDALRTFQSYADDLRIWQQRVAGTAPEDSHWYWMDVDGAADVVVTLVFERHVTGSCAAPPANAGNACNGDADCDSSPGDGICSVAAPILNDLDLWLYDPTGSQVDFSASDSDSVEHIVYAPGSSGRYCLEVDPYNLDTDGSELYAVASSHRLHFNGSFNPCHPDFGDAPDPFITTSRYPTRLSSDGARHLDWTKEWLGTLRPEIDGELQKTTLAVRSRVDPYPSVSGEDDANDPDDQDGRTNLDNADKFDDGIGLPDVFSPGVPEAVTLTVQTTVDDTGVGPNGRYQAGVATKRLYANGWCDWNGDGDWTDVDEKIIGEDSPAGPFPVDPETFGPNGRYTIGEAFTDLNGSGAWEPGEAFTDTVGKTEKSFTIMVTPPALVLLPFYCRFRLDYGEDVGRVANISGDLDEELGAAQFGEVEDHLVSTCAATTLEGSPRTLTFAAEGGPAAIKITPVELQNVVPPNAACCPPQDFGAFEAGSCTAEATPTPAGVGGCHRWVGRPSTYLEANDASHSGWYRASRLQCTPFYYSWSSEPQGGLINVVGAEIIPSSCYTVRFYDSACQGVEGGCENVSSPFIIKTRRAGDVAAPFQPPAPPLTQPNALDVTALVNKFRNLFGALSKTVTQLQPNAPDPNADISAIDIVSVVDNFRGFAYLFSGPCACPSSVPCNATPCAGPSQCIGAYGAGATCLKTCIGGVNAGHPCVNNRSCNQCAGGVFHALPCDPASVLCPGGACPSLGTCGTGFCRDRCGRCN